jgi:phospholipase/lecithinase/hemolysin
MLPNTSTFIRLVGGLAFAMATTGSLLAGEVQDVVVFGDSLSDPGNHFIAFGESATRPFESVPSASYAIGGHHFSNGRTWIEQLVSGSPAEPSAGPALGHSPRASNYAMGRARARANAADFPLYDLSAQVGHFLADYGGTAPADKLYVLWIGGNDVRDALTTIATGGGSIESQLAGQQILGSAVQAILDNVIALYASGARSFLVVNVPDPANTPVVRALPPIVRAIATQLSSGFNSGLAQVLGALPQALPGTNFVSLDADAVLAGIINDPASAGLEDVTSPCLTAGVTKRAICSEPRAHLFWDGTHPTVAGHGVVAQAAATALYGH